MSKDIPDYMRGFDLNDDWGFTPVSSKPESDDKSNVDLSLIKNSSLEIPKVL